MGIPQILVDSDGPVCSFDLECRRSGLPADQFKHLPGVYLWLPITAGAKFSLEVLKSLDDQNLAKIWILTKTPSGSPYAYTEKVLWYRRNFPWLEDRVILTHDKSIVGTVGDWLLDDRPHKANASLFRGNFRFFDVEKPEESWKSFLDDIEGIL